MSRAAKITRRTLLLGAVTIAGGAAFGFYQIRKPLPNPVAGLGAALTPYVLVDAQGLSIIVPRAEMGQGVHTTLAALVAEELDVSLADIRVLHGPPARAYYNAALAHAALPVADHAQSDFQRRVSETLGRASRVLGLQITGGSTSTVDAFARMRLAGAGAREALKAAAAERLGVDVSRLTTGDGHVIAPDGTSLSYADLAADAATRSVPEPVLRSPSEWKLLGRAQPRTDMRAKVTGQAQFSTDINLPGLKCATLRMCPVPGGSMTAFDPAPALAIAGVERVLDMGNGIAVIARNTWAAMEGARAVQIDWATPERPEDTDALFDTIAASFARRANSTLRDDGDVDAALAQGDPLEVEYRVPFLAHTTMEPMGATAWMQDAHLTLWVGNQAPRAHVAAAAKAAGISPGDVTLHTTFLGGGFGRRVESDVTAQAARIAAAMPGTPIRLSWSREEDIAHDFYRPGAIARMRGLTEGGRITVLDARVAAPSVTHQFMGRMIGAPALGADKGHVEGLFDQPYAIPNIRVAGHLAQLDVPLGFWRAVGNSQNAFFHDCFIDELALREGVDPLEFRLRHIAPQSPVAAGVLEGVRDLSGWNGTRGKGRGVAFAWSFGTPVAQVIDLEDEGGRIRIARAFIVCDPGLVLDPGIVRAQMESGLVYGLSAALMGQITFTGGAVDQRNFPDYDALRMHQMPAVEVAIRQDNPHMGGVGEPGLPPAAPALANALHDLTGIRARTLPLQDHADFVL